MNLTVNVWKKNKEYVANCPELEIFCYGFNEKQARLRLKKVILFYAETAADLGYHIDMEELLPSIQETNQTQECPPNRAQRIFS